MFGRILTLVADVAGITARYAALKPVLEERARRLVAAAESQAIGDWNYEIQPRIPPI